MAGTEKIRPSGHTFLLVVLIFYLYMYYHFNMANKVPTTSRLRSINQLSW